MINKKVLCIFLGLFSATSVMARDGQVNFTGSVADAACVIDSDSRSQSVNMGRISTSAFVGAGKVSGPSRFAIKVSNCPGNVNSANVQFTGSADTKNPMLLALNSGSTASGVGIAIYEDDGVTQIPLYSSSSDRNINSDGSTSTLYFVAKYMSTAALVNPGSANSVAEFTMAYN